jgi:hypothetical protein
MISVWFRELCKRHGNGLGRYRFPLMGCWNLRCHSFHPLPSHTERRMIRFILCHLTQAQSLCPAINFQSICIRPVAPNRDNFVCSFRSLVIIFISTNKGPEFRRTFVYKDCRACERFCDSNWFRWPRWVLPHSVCSGYPCMCIFYRFPVSRPPGKKRWRT